MNTIFETWRNNLKLKNRADEWEAKELMRLAGLPVPPQYLVSGEQAAGAITSIDFLPEEVREPYVVKLCSPEVLHKTDVGGVRLGVSRKDLPAVLKELSLSFPGENLLLYHMEEIKGIEFILGALNDPSFGPAVMVGAGGVMTEIYKDVSFCLAPCSLKDAEHILSELTIAPVLTGFRGSTLDRESLKKIIVRFSLLAAAAAEAGAQLDINPIVWNGNAWKILDAKCVL